MTWGRWTFTSYFGNTGARRDPVQRGGISGAEGRRRELKPTVFLDVEAVEDLLPFIRPGADDVASLLGLGDHGVLQIQDAPRDGFIQPLGDPVVVGILGGGETSVKVRKMKGNGSNVICGLTSSSTSLYWERERERERRLAVTRTGPEHLNEFPGLILATPMENASSPY